MKELTTVGTGFVVPDQITSETVTAIREAQRVFTLVEHPERLKWLRDHNQNLEPLNHFYGGGNKSRLTTYSEISEHVVNSLAELDKVCFVVYGNPGLLSEPSHLSIIKAREAGHKARMLTAVSAQDCLMADLAVDGGLGVEAYEASDLIVFERQWDLTRPRVLWQIGVVGEFGGAPKLATEGLALVGEHLSELYGPDHEIAIYVAATEPSKEPEVVYCAAEELSQHQPNPVATLYVPPKGTKVWRTVPRSQTALHVLGLGLRPELQTTRMTEELLDSGWPVFGHRLGSSEQAWLKGRGIEVLDWDESRLLEQASSGSVVALYSGHPAFHGGAKLMEQAAKQGIAARMEPCSSLLSELAACSDAKFDMGYQWFARGSGDLWCPGVSLTPLTDEVASFFQPLAIERAADGLLLREGSSQTPCLWIPREQPPATTVRQQRLDSLAAGSKCYFHLRSLPEPTLERWREIRRPEFNDQQLFEGAMHFALAELVRASEEAGLGDDQDKFMAYFQENPESPLANLTQLALNSQRGLESLKQGIPQERVRLLLEV